MLRLRRLVMDHRRILASVLAGLAVLAALTSLRQDAGGSTAIVARRDLASGAVVRADDLRQVRLGADHDVAHRLGPDEVVGRRLAGAVRAGEVMTDRRLLSTTLADRRDRGTVVTTVALESEDALGPARVGDRVDVLAVSPDDGTPATIVARGLQLVAIRSSAETGPVLLDLAAPSDAAIDLVTAGQRSQLSVLVSTPATGRR